ncbi:hypothetical protein B0H12DRAFT_1092915 [Mycena haematopus]|nr:hypothetical protein B0H12DRAFT_1092915 [Mycena haematopus]
MDDSDSSLPTFAIGLSFARLAEARAGPEFDLFFQDEVQVELMRRKKVRAHRC